MTALMCGIECKYEHVGYGKEASTLANARVEDMDLWSRGTTFPVAQRNPDASAYGNSSLSFGYSVIQHGGVCASFS